MNSVSSSTGSYQAAMMQGMGGPRGRPRPEASDVAEQLFSKLDTDNQGYLEVSDFTSAISQLSANQQQASGEEVFSSLDSDSDGKLTQDELTTGIQALQDQLDSQFNAMRVQQGMDGMGGMPPPPPGGGHGGHGGHGDDQGLDQSQLSDMASAATQVGDSQGASMFSDLADNFDEADANGDGKVTFSESVAYREQQQTANSSEDDSADTTSSNSSLTQEMQGRLAHRLMEMMRAYDDYQSSNTGSAGFAA